MNNNGFPPMVIMGVSGSGKSPVGALLGERLGIGFIDGDELHPAENKEKMRAGIPLNDEDRAPWLRAIGRTMGSHQQEGSSPVLPLNAATGPPSPARPGLLFPDLHGSMDTLAARTAARDHEFMPVTLLASQLEALEPLEPDEAHVILGVRQSPAELAQRAEDALIGRMSKARTTPTGE